MNDNIQDSERPAPKQRYRAAFAATFACFAGVGLGLYAGIITKQSDPVRQVEWTVPEQTVASRGTEDTVSR